MRDITVVTGTRAEYGLLQSSMGAIREHPGLSLSVVATGMHLSPQHGDTVEEIRRDGFEVTRQVHSLVAGDTGVAMAKSLGLGVQGLASALADIEPDIVLVLGDRDEAFAAAVAAAHMNVPVAHVHGGDAMHGAIIDDSIRHAITKFAHIHFPVSERSKERILRLGEEAWRAEVVGAPGLDAVRSGAYVTPDGVAEEYDVDPDRPLALVVQHPVTTRPDRAGDQLRATLDALQGVDVQRVVIYPNADAGGDRMIDVIEDYATDGSIRAYRNLPREDYLGLMATADVMVGNSSSAIIEAPSLGLPAVDVGPRQEGRERAENTIEVPHDEGAIRAAVDTALNDDAVRQRARDCDNPYDYGGAGGRIADRLASIELDDELIRKRLTY